jgi:hypothetical protein
MIIIGVDYHPEFQQIASVDTNTGEFQEKRLARPEEAEQFYRALAGQNVRVGMEASGHARWFEFRVAFHLAPSFKLGVGPVLRKHHPKGLRHSEQSGRRERVGSPVVDVDVMHLAPPRPRLHERAQQ